MADISLVITYFAFLLGIGVLIANVLRKRNIPDDFFLVIFGLLVGPTIFLQPAITAVMSIKLVDVPAMGDIPGFLRLLALIFSVFTGTFNLNMRLFKRYSDISIKLAFGFVIFTTVVAGFAASWLFKMDLLYALLLGAIVSGTGTGVLFSVERALSKSKKAITLLKLESIFNTPVSVLIPILFLDLVYLQPGAVMEPMKYMSEFWQMIAAGVGTGIVVGFGMAKIMKRMVQDYSVLMVLAISLLTYALAEGVGGSGMLAVAICGLMVGNMTFKERDDVRKFEDHFWEMLRISVLAMLGAEVALFMSWNDFMLALIFFAIVFLIRPLIVIPILGKMREGMTMKDLIIISFIAPRGTDSAAIAPLVVAALITAGSAGVAGTIMNITFIVIIFSILLSALIAFMASRNILIKDGPTLGEMKKSKEGRAPKRGQEKEQPEFKHEEYQEIKIAEAEQPAASVAPPAEKPKKKKTVKIEKLKF